MKAACRIVQLLVLNTLCTGGYGYRILFQHPLYSGSHVLTLQRLASGLLDKGHHVTTLMYRDSELPKLKNKMHSNFTLIELTVNNTDGRVPFVEQVEAGEFRLPMEVVWQSGNNFQWALRMLFSSAYHLHKEYCTTVLDPKLVSKLRKGSFNVMVIDLMFNECGLALAHQLGIPTVVYWSTFEPGMQEFTSLPSNPAYVPMFMSGFSNNMNLAERSMNLLYKLVTRLATQFVYFSFLDSFISQMTSPSTPSATQLLANIDAMLINTDDVIDYPRTKPPTFINIGGLQIQESPDELPAELAGLMETAQHGVILFTMGFIFDSKVVPRSMIENLLAAFSRLKQTVIFKYKPQNASLLIPKNVKLMSWVPQQAVLAHKKTVLFMTHCGMHGTLEAIYHAVPMVGIPVFIDQKDVMRRLEDKGAGVRLDKDASANTIHSTIIEVLDKPEYRRNVNKLSKLIRDRKESPMESATWLVEYIARHNGAKHLRIPSGDLSMISYLCLDSALLILGSMVILYGLLVCFLSAVRKLLTRVATANRQLGEAYKKAKVH